MLARVDDAEQARGLDWEEFADHVLVVRQPLPACERMRGIRPLVVIVGPTIAGRDVDLLSHTAREVGSELVELRAVVPRAALRDVLRRAVARASSRPASASAGLRGAGGGPR
jgi:hypothetical protein